MSLKRFLIWGWVFFVCTICLIGAGCDPRELPGIKEQLNRAAKEETKAVDEMIKNNPNLRELDDLCKDILPEDRFTFVSKSMSSHGPPALYYHYYSEISFDKSERVLTDYFSKDGWNVSEDQTVLDKILEFTKDKFVFRVQFGGIGGNVNYAITCQYSPSEQKKPMR